MAQMYRTWKGRNSCKIFIRKTKMKRLTYRWENNIQVDLKCEMWCGFVRPHPISFKMFTYPQFNIKIIYLPF